MMKLAEILEGHLGIRIATENNLRKMLTKVNSSIEGAATWNMGVDSSRTLSPLARRDT